MYKRSQSPFSGRIIAFTFIKFSKIVRSCHHHSCDCQLTRSNFVTKFNFSGYPCPLNWDCKLWQKAQFWKGASKQASTSRGWKISKWYIQIELDFRFFFSPPKYCIKRYLFLFSCLLHTAMLPGEYKHSKLLKETRYHFLAHIFCRLQ